MFFGAHHRVLRQGATCMHSSVAKTYLLFDEARGHGRGGDRSNCFPLFCKLLTCILVNASERGRDLELRSHCQAFRSYYQIDKTTIINTIINNLAFESLPSTISYIMWEAEAPSPHLLSRSYFEYSSRSEFISFISRGRAWEGD